jgi:hypothetical protein
MSLKALVVVAIDEICFFCFKPKVQQAKPVVAYHMFTADGELRSGGFKPYTV